MRTLFDGFKKADPCVLSSAIGEPVPGMADDALVVRSFLCQGM